MTKILVVDDASMDRKLAEGMLQKVDGWDVATVTGGHEALNRIGEFQPDLVLSDLQMPEMNGLQLVQHIKKDHPNLPVVVMTARGSETIAVEALQNGAASYVPKKLLHRLLVNTVMRVLASSDEKQVRRELMDGLNKVSWQFSISNEGSVLASLVGFVQSEVSRTGLIPETDGFRCGVAFEEALLNAAYHGNLEVSSDLREENPQEFYDLARQRTEIEPYKQRRISVSVSIDQERVEYVVEDEGPGFNPHAVPDPTHEEFLDKPSGRGLLLMKTFMDDVQFNDVGNRVTMTKRAPKTTSST